MRDVKRVGPVAVAVLILLFSGAVSWGGNTMTNQLVIETHLNWPQSIKYGGIGGLLFGSVITLWTAIRLRENQTHWDVTDMLLSLFGWTAAFAMANLISLWLASQEILLVYLPPIVFLWLTTVTYGGFLGALGGFTITLTAPDLAATPTLKIIFLELVTFVGAGVISAILVDIVATVAHPGFWVPPNTFDQVSIVWAMGGATFTGVSGMLTAAVVSHMATA